MNNLSILAFPVMLFASTAAWSQAAEAPQAANEHPQHQSAAGPATGQTMCCCDKEMMRKMMEMMQHQGMGHSAPANQETAHEHSH